MVISESLHVTKGRTNHLRISIRYLYRLLGLLDRVHKAVCHDYLLPELGQV